MHMKVIFLLAVICGLVSTGMATDNQLESQLTSQYQTKLLALRHSFESNSQEYTADGTPLTAGKEGPWTVYGRLIVQKIKVDPDRVRIEGKRAVCFFDKSGQMVQFREDRKHPAESLSVTLRLQQPLSSPDEATAVLGRVFVQTPEEIVSAAPSYWQTYLAKTLTSKATKDDTQASGKDRLQLLNKATGTDEGDKVLQLGAPNVKPPRILNQSEPQFTDAARARRFQGVVGLSIVVDRSGTVRNVQIIHPLGMGLDENAVATVSTWRFTPATKDGQPVAVAVYVEVDFHLW
jgi:TonB family protein